MKIIPTEINDVKIIEPDIFEDERGIFFESFNKKQFKEKVDLKKENINFVQDNHSLSKKNVLRGLHYQVNPAAQCKLVRVVSGAIYDVAVDIRESSPTFGSWVGINLDSIKNRQLWVPCGFAHGFVSLEDDTIINYKTNCFYNKLCDRSILWNDETLDIKWPINNDPLISNKDKNASKFLEAEFFK